MSVWLLVTLAVLAFGGRFAWMLYNRVAPQEAKRLVQSGATLIDLRPRSEFQVGHLPHARNVPLADLARRSKEMGNRNRPVVVYAQGMSASSTGARILRDAGFTDVHDLGDMSRWP